MPNEVDTADLIGYVRLDRIREVLKVNLSKDALEKARRYTSQEGTEYVSLHIDLKRLQSVLDGDREVTSVCQLEAA